jgi:hypothetical protein
LLNILALSGFVVRDRSVLMAFLMYLPLAPIGIFTLGLGGLDLRKRQRKSRAAVLIAVGLASTACGCWWMVGRSTRGTGVSEAKDAIRLMHWNVLWGGYWESSRGSWNSIVADIVDRDPDIAVLSEAPPLSEMYEEFKRLPGRRFELSISGSKPRSHVYHFYVSSRWPLHLERRVDIVHGVGAVVVVHRPSRPVMLLLVDGQSRITRLRTPMLHDIARVAAGMAQAGTPADAIVGDFNAVSRSLGFEELSQTAGGYRLASRSCAGWRGTWPSFFPVFDIDHIWIRAGWEILGCKVFTNLGTDHRGQIVQLGHG